MKNNFYKNEKGITLLQLCLLVIIFILIVMIIGSILIAKDRMVDRSERFKRDYGYINYGAEVEHVRNNILLKYDELEQSVSLEQLAHEMMENADWILAAYVYMNDEGVDEYIVVVTKERYTFHVNYDWITRVEE